MKSALRTAMIFVLFFAGVVLFGLLLRLIFGGGGGDLDAVPVNRFDY